MHPPLQQIFVIIGAGGHASVVAAALRAMDAAICGFTDRDPALAGSLVMGAPILGDDSVLDTIDIDSVRFANGLGIQPKVRGLETPDPGTGLRRRIFETLTSRAFCFPPIFHPSAVLADIAEIGSGAQVMAGTVVQSRTVIRQNAIVNSSASIDRRSGHAVDVIGLVRCHRKTAQAVRRLYS